MSAFDSQIQQKQQSGSNILNHYNQLDRIQKQKQQDDIRHSNEFLSDSYDEQDKNNYYSIGLTPNNMNLIENKEIIQLQKEQERQNHQNAVPMVEELAKNQYINQCGNALMQSFQNDDYEFCPNCNRKFFAGRLNLHLKSCKPNKPLKPQKKQSQPSQHNDQNTNEQEKCQGNQIQNVSSSKQIPSAIPIDVPVTNDNKKGIAIKKQSNQYHQKSQVSKSSNQDSTQDNSEKDDSYIQQQSNYNLEQFENKIITTQIENNEDSRVQCSICSRKFMSDRLEKHENICRKSQKPRPIYNSSEARCPEDQNGQKLIPKSKLLPPQAAKKVLEQSVLKTKDSHQINNDYSSLKENQSVSTLQMNTSQVKKLNNQSKNQTPIHSKKNYKEGEENIKKVPKWKLEHQQFIENIRYNKMVKQVEKEGGDISKIEKPVDNLEALGYVSCQYCLRRFAKETAERHIPLCKNIINRPKPPIQPSRQHSEKITVQNNQNSENKKQNVRITPKYNQSIDQLEQSLKQSSTNVDSQYQTNDNSEQGSLYSHKTLNSTRGYGTLKLSQKLSTSMNDKQQIENNLKCRTGLLPEINLKQQEDKKYYTSRKIGTYKNRNNTANNISNSVIQNQKTYEDVYTRTTQISSVCCPYCERVFAKNAADRHIPICKNIINRPNPLQDIIRNTKQDFSKKITTQLIKNKQRQNIELSQKSLNGDSYRIVIDEYQKPRTSESSSSTKIPYILGSAKSQKFCGFCGFQFAMDYKYCGCCGKKRFSTSNKTQIQNVQQGSKNNFQSTVYNNITTIIE